MSHIKDLQEYLKSKFGIKTTLIENDVNSLFSYFNKVSDIYYYYALNILGLVILLFGLYAFFFIYKSGIIEKIEFPEWIKKNNLLFWIIIIVLFIFIVIYLLFNIIRKICMLKNYYHFQKRDKYIYKHAKDFHDIKFKTGSVIQEGTQWNWTGQMMDIILSIFPTNYMHNMMVINYKGHAYGLHFGGASLYPNEIIKFNQGDIRLFDLENYMKNNLLYNDKYRVFLPKKELKSEKIFSSIEKLFEDSKQYEFGTNFQFFYNIHQLVNYRYYNCLSFLLKLLNMMKIIPFFNFNGTLPDDMYFLPKMSDGFFKGEQIFTYQ